MIIQWPVGSSPAHSKYFNNSISQTPHILGFVDAGVLEQQNLTFRWSKLNHKVKLKSSPTFTDVTVSSLTANKPAWSDADKKIVSQDIVLCDIVRNKITPTTQTVNTGTLTAGSVSDVQTWADGNEVHISEVTGVPGFDVEYTMANVADFCAIGIAFYYVGSGTHSCAWQIYDDTNTTWRTLFDQTGAGLNHNYRFTDFPGSVTDYINSSDEVKIRAYHPQSGDASASHDLYIDYVSIIGDTV